MTAKLLRMTALTGLFALIAAFHMAALRQGHVWGDDFAQYVHHAKNLVEGVPYADTGYLYNVEYAEVGPPTYPPVVPAMLAPVYWAYGLDLEAMKWVMLASFIAFLAATAAYFRDDLPFGAVLALVALLGFNRALIDDTTTISSDLPFLAFLYLTWLLVQQGEKAAARPRARACWYVAAGLTAYLAYGARTVGLVIMPAVVLADLARFRRITLPVLAGCAVFGVLAGAQAALFHSGGRYLDQLTADVPWLLRNASMYARDLAAFWHNGYYKPAGAAIAAVVTALSLAGYVAAVRRGPGAREIFPLLYLAVVLVWPSYQGIRMLYPVVPLWLFYAMKGLEHPWLSGRPRLRRGLIAALVVAAAASYAAVDQKRERGPFEEGVGRAESVALFAYVREHTAADDVIVFIKPRAMALYTGRRASVYHRPTDDRELWDYFAKIRAGYVVVVNRDEALQGAERAEALDYMRQFVARNRGRFESVWSNADFTLYRLRPAVKADP